MRLVNIRLKGVISLLQNYNLDRMGVLTGKLLAKKLHWILVYIVFYSASSPRTVQDVVQFFDILLHPNMTASNPFW